MGDTAVLAWRTMRIVDIALVVRERGRCVGDPSPAEFARMIDHGSVTGSKRAAAVPLETPRGARGVHAHDRGCVALGIAEQVLRKLLEAWDRNGAATYLGEGVADALNELEALSGRWTSARARESLEYALRSRITPRANGG